MSVRIIIIVVFVVDVIIRCVICVFANDLIISILVLSVRLRRNLFRLFQGDIGCAFLQSRVILAVVRGPEAVDGYDTVIPAALAPDDDIPSSGGYSRP